MKNAANKSFDDEELGTADQAAVLGADGGPARPATGTQLTVLDDDLDDEWLDEELTDEELAALGEEDFEAAFDDEFDDILDDLGGDLDTDFEDDLSINDDDPNGIVSGDLDDIDEIDDFEILELPPSTDAQVRAEQSGGASPAPVSESAPSQASNDPASEDYDPLGDDLFDDFSEAETVAPPPRAEQSFDHEYGDPAIDDDGLGETGQIDDDPADTDETVHFEMDDEFSIDDELKEPEADTSGGGAVVVKGAHSEVAKKAKGKVAASVSSDDNDEDSGAEPDFDFSDADEQSGGHHRPVPRISIHAFCETARNSKILEQAAVDRRLSKAHFTMHMGGVEKAIDLYQSSSTPNLIVLETTRGGVELIQQLGQLAEVCDPSSKVVIIGKVNDIRLYRELIRQGISEYIVNPKSPLQVIKSISELYVDPSAPPIGKNHCICRDPWRCRLIDHRPQCGVVLCGGFQE